MNTESNDNVPLWIKEEEARQKKELDHLFFLANEKKRMNEAKEQQRFYREQRRNENQIRRETTMRPSRETTRSLTEIEVGIQELQEYTDREIAKKVNQGLVTARYSQAGVTLTPRIPKSYTAEYAKHLTRFQRA